MTDWEAIHQSRHWGTYPEIYMVRQVKAFMAGKAGTVSALDIGCGAGAHSWMMKREGMEVTAFDVSPTAVSRMAQMGVLAMVGDVNSIEFVPESFDFILDNLSLTHVPSFTFTRVESWLKRGGRFLSASFLVPPPGAPPSWPAYMGTRIETHTREVDGHIHVIGLTRYDKPHA